MTVYELTREQLCELKERYMIMAAEQGDYSELFGVTWDFPSWGEIAMCDELVPDEVIFENYELYTFGEDDFFCTAGKE